MAEVVGEGDVAAFAEAIERRFGHEPDARRVEALRTLLAGRLRAVGAKNYADYGRWLAGDAEWHVLAPLLTVPETYFWRLPDHFDALAADVLPKLIAHNTGTRTLRMLSAGCASGEEAYTLRMLLNERFPELTGWRVEIVGVDVSDAALARARAGVYSEWSLRGTSEARRRVHFTKVGKLWKLNAAARVGVTFRRENLLEAPGSAMAGGEAAYDVIFCRNVLIYFSGAAVRAAVDGLTARLAAEGYLFLGPAESLRGGTEAFALCRSHEVFYYRRKEAGGTVVQESAGADWYARIGDSATKVAGMSNAVQEPEEAVRGATADGLVRASALTEAGRYGEAETECHRLLAECALNAGAHFLLGMCREQMGDLDDAEKQMTRATYLEPGFSMAHFHCGLISRRRGDEGAAVKSFRLAMAAVAAEDEARLALFGGGFSREGLRQICVRELKRLEDKR